MAKKSKKYIEALNQIEKGKAYTKEEAVELVKKVSTSKFDGSVEVAMKLNLDTRKSDQQLRGAIVLPNGTGKTKRILVLSKTNQAQIAKEAGADFVGDADLVEKIEKENWLDFDVIIATPEMMPMLGKLGKVLGPRGLMPNPKTGTVTTDVKKAIDDITLFSEDLEQNGIETVEEVELKFHIFDNESYDTIADSDVISFSAK